jgi:hypothetical protein
MIRSTPRRVLYSLATPGGGNQKGSSELILRVGVEEARMPENPLCPNCGRKMRISRTLPPDGDDPESHVFECAICNISFITEDHLPIAGRRVH